MWQLIACCLNAPMAMTKLLVERDTRRRLRRQEVRLGEEIRRLRLDAGLSLRELAAVVGIHHSHLARIEAAQVTPGLEALIAIGVPLGADLSVRYFTGVGPRLHDRFQAPMLEALLHMVDAGWSVRLEVPVTTPARGVIDAVLDDETSPTTIASELQSQLPRLEQQIRWSSEKAEALADRSRRDRPPSEGRSVSRLLILRSTIATREVAREYAATLAAAYPAKCSAVFDALTTARPPWPGDGLIWARVDGGRAEILDRPPRGVALGR